MPCYAAQSRPLTAPAGGVLLTRLAPAGTGRPLFGIHERYVHGVAWDAYNWIAATAFSQLIGRFCAV